jgi:hypothetical protein
VHDRRLLFAGRCHFCVSAGKIAAIDTLSDPHACTNSTSPHSTTPTRSQQTTTRSNTAGLRLIGRFFLLAGPGLVAAAMVIVPAGRWLGWRELWLRRV